MPEDFAGQPDEGQELDFTADEGVETTDEAQSETGQDDPVVDIDGKQYRASELREFIKGGMLERDYRQKTTSLAREREQIGELRQAAEAWQTVQEHPQLMHALGTAIAQLLQGDEAGAASTMSQAAAAEQDLPGGQPGQPAEAWKSELDRMKSAVGGALGAFDQRFQEYNKYMWDQYYANREAYAQGQMTALQEKYPFLVAEEVTTAFRDNPNFKLEDIAKASHDHWQAWYQDRQKANMDKRRSNANARVAVPGAKAGAPVTKANEESLDWDTARKSAYERLKKVGSLFGT